MCVPGAKSEGKDLSPQMMEGALELYTGMHPKDSIDAILATFMVNISNLANTSLAHAAHLPPGLSDPIFRTALKAGTVLNDIVKTYDARRRQNAEKVTVGQVNVESGGQAIVGTVETGSKKE